MTPTILIADDEPVQRRILENTILKLGYRCQQVEDGEAALAHLASPQGANVAAVILDLVMPGLDGMGVLARMREQGLSQPVIVQTSQGSIDAVVSAMRAGACDFCVKPVSFERLKVSIANALKFDAMESAVRRVERAGTGTFTFADMIASSPAMDRAMDLGRRAAASTIPVLIEGESGVGKEVIARAIQGESAKRGKPFITVNCGALPENLAESILFGHEKGAFTGADRAHVGKFKQADGGTLFLDEVGELSLELQVKLLRAIQEGEIDPVGSRKPVKTDVRLISATNRDMIAQVKAGEFREDLYYRLNVFPLTVPPLRKRVEDIAPLAQHFAARIALEEGRRGIQGLSREAIALLGEYDWPGNVRQLENAIFRAVVLCDGAELTPTEFPQILAALGKDVPLPLPSSMASKPRTVVDAVVSIAPELPVMQASSEPVQHYGSARLLNDEGAVRALEEVEADAIRFAIDHHRGRMTRVARSLRIGRSTLYRRLKELGLGPAASEEELEQTE
ncbi:sigma-54 dependent transcriptional regulator [Ahrensia sp. R2A130]|uniref:sigma-54-dependent transcriptional regulator n=1 Tax=Ahrensia sp. R2A130 TaxID=744979 RepID=UPI0001E0ACA1|nr:sigma-54 dependent transcriptional regulator [Ahrensia sp. R2A130]EFL88656.1 acetoacetate metabolism regulatory protein AtoC [Ahrensia sp. R2A130]